MKWEMEEKKGNEWIFLKKGLDKRSKRDYYIETFQSTIQ